MKEKDFLICKRSYNNIKINYDNYMSLVNGKIIFKRNQKYQLEKIEKFDWGILVYGLPIISYTYFVDGIIVSHSFIEKIFYSEQEMRNLKLKKINDLRIDSNEDFYVKYF